MKNLKILFLLLVGFLSDAQIVRLIDSNSGLNVNYKKVNSTPFIDGVVYREKSGVKYKLLEDGELNVKFFGAIGDGTTDDTNAIQRAFDFLYKIKETNNYDAAEFSAIKIPTGTYRITRPLIFPTGFILKGIGKHSSKIFYDNLLDNAIVIKEKKNLPNNYENKFFTEIKDLTIYGKRYKNQNFYQENPSHTNNGIYLNSVLKVKVNNVEIGYFDNSNILLDSVYYTNLFDCYLHNSRYGVSSIATNSNPAMAVNTSLSIDNSEIRTNSVGLYLTKIYASLVTNSTIEGNLAPINKFVFDDQTGLPENQNSVGIILKDASSVKFIANYIEAHNLTFSFTNSNSNMIRDNIIVPYDLWHHSNTNNPQTGKNYQILVFLMQNSNRNQFVTNEFLTSDVQIPEISVSAANSQKNYIEFIRESTYSKYLTFYDILNRENVLTASIKP